MSSGTIEHLKEGKKNIFFFPSPEYHVLNDCDFQEEPMYWILFCFMLLIKETG